MALTALLITATLFNPVASKPAQPTFCSPFNEVTGQAKPAFAFKAEKFGHGKPVIFIPGLGCGGKVWEPTIEKLKAHYTCYEITLPGFGGVTPISTRPLLKEMCRQMIKFIAVNHIHKPVIVGHSLGGFLAWWIGEKDSKGLAGIVAVDGVPYLSALSNPAATSKSMMPYVSMVKSMFAKQSTDKFNATEESSLKQMITSPENIKFVEKCSGPPDIATFADTVGEMMVTDLRPNVSKVTCPAYQMMSGKSYGASQATYEKAYLAQVKGVKNLRFKDYTNSLHFIMLDQPAEFMADLTQFLNKVSK